MSPPYNFMVEIADESGAVCQQECTVNVGPGCGAADWIGDPAILCRLRIKNYTDGDFALAAPCAAGGAVPWDGTFTIRHIVAFPTLVTYDSFGLAFNQISGRTTTGNNDIISWNAITTQWNLALGCSAGSFWIGDRAAGISPIGIYVPTFDAFAIGNIEIEAYLPP